MSQPKRSDASQINNGKEPLHLVMNRLRSITMNRRISSAAVALALMMTVSGAHAVALTVALKKRVIDVRTRRVEVSNQCHNRASKGGCVMISPGRYFFGALLVVFLMTGTVQAQGLVFTNQCTNQLTTADRALFVQAFALLDSYKYKVEEHLNASMLVGNPDSYTVITNSMMTVWRAGVAEMGRGDIKLACEYNATSNKCNNMPGLSGWTFDFDPLIGLRDRIHICIDNVRALTTTGSPPAMLAGVLSHELIHHIDGYDPHGVGGFTTPANPQTTAETIGVAMEHAIMTPDLRATIKSIDSSFANSTHNLGINVKVTNLNPQASAGLTPMSGRQRNLTTTLRLQVEGVSLSNIIVAPLNGTTSTIKTFYTSIPAYDVSTDSEYSLVATADTTALLVEDDEGNNVDNATYSTAVDLSTSVEVSGPPVCHSLEYRGDVYPIGYYNWYQIPYRASVKNRSNRTYAGTSDVVMMYENMWTTSAMTSQQEVWLSSLAPSETKTVDFYLEVPTTASCMGPIGATDVWFIADWNSTSVFDSNRNNNSVYFNVDSNYWKPDYVISSVTRGSSATRMVGQVDGDLGSFYAPISYKIRNIGPATASVPPLMSMSHTQVLDPSGVRVFSAVTGDIRPGGESTYDTSVNDHGCDPLTFVVEADYAHAINELAENNNTAKITLDSIGYCVTQPINNP